MKILSFNRGKNRKSSTVGKARPFEELSPHVQKAMKRVEEQARRKPKINLVKKFEQRIIDILLGKND